MTDDDLFVLLESYVQDLHAGRRPDRAALLAAHPQLAGALQCLDDLQRLAPDANAPATGEYVPGQGDTLPAADAPPAADFAQYELLGELGRGGMGVVYRARQKGLDRLVAIKMVLAGRFSSPEQARRFAAEARLAARLQHPNIVRIFDCGELHGQQYFVMEYVAGPSLAELLRHGPLPPDEAARLAATLARAADHLHAHQIVHRDLKPANVLLESHGAQSVGLGDATPKIADFGLAKLLEGDSHQTTTGVIAGTPSYMAPEQAMGRRELIGPRADVYSLGAILYELLTGRPPFREESPLDTLVQVLENEPARPRHLNPAVPRSLERICLKCLEKSPDERYASAAALADDLDRFLAREPVEAQRPTPWQRVRRWSSRQPALAARLGAILVFLAILQARYFLVDGISVRLHLQVVAGLGAWALASWVFQLCLRSDRWAQAARFAWSATDVAIVTWLLILSDYQAGPLLVSYPVLIASAGLWFRESVVWFTTAASLAAYAVILAWPSTPDLPVREGHQHLLFMVALVVLGFGVAYQVRRVRALSRFYQHRALP